MYTIMNICFWYWNLG